MVVVWRAGGLAAVYPRVGGIHTFSEVCPTLDPNLRTDPVPTLLLAYRRGLFPMADDSEPDGEIRWFRPDPRAVLPLSEEEGFHVPRRLATRLRTAPFVLTTDVAFEAVMRGCARPRRSEDGTWIDERFVRAYGALHRAGFAHSIEVWADAGVGADAAEVSEVDGRRLALVGGLYGVHLGGMFMAESKFHRAELGGTDASKVALVALVRHLRSRGFACCDVQLSNLHTARFGVREMPAREYERLLESHAERRVPWQPFSPPGLERMLPSRPLRR